METTSIKPKILILLHFSHQQEQQFIERLTEAERTATGTVDSWAAKEVLGSIMTWKQLQTQKLAMAVRGETPPVWRDRQVVDQINNDAFVQHRQKNLRDTQEEAKHVYHALVKQVESLSEAELSNPDLYEWQEQEPLWQETLGNGLWHPATQITDYYLKRGNRQAALQVQEELLVAVRRVELPPGELSGAVYNVACFFARNGWPEKALPLLSEALQLRATLVEVAKHDSDLDSLRADPAFQALFQDVVSEMDNLLSPREVSNALAHDLPPFIIDVRGASEFTAGHVLGAKNIPLGQLARKLAQIPRDRQVVTYCNMHHRGASRGERGSALLREHGLQAKTLDGGYPAWKDAGLPVEGE